jgi:ATP-dependent Lon protease
MNERRNKQGAEPGNGEAAGRARSFAAALSALPIFPLPQVVLFPEAVLPLHVFEPRYRAMLKHCLATHGALIIAQIVGGEDDHGRPRIADIAGGGLVVEHQSLPDGRANIVVRGQARLRLHELDPDDARPYRMARATLLEERSVSVPEHDRVALVAAATMFATEVKKHDPSFVFRMPATPNAGNIADLCAFQLVVDPATRQAALDELDPRARVTLVLNQLALQQSAMMRRGGDRVLN